MGFAYDRQKRKLEIKHRLEREQREARRSERRLETIKLFGALRRGAPRTTGRPRYDPRMVVVAETLDLYPD